MTWTDPTTRSTGDLITAAIWNTDVVDNLEFLHDRVVDRFFPVTGASSGGTLTLQNKRGVVELNAAGERAAVNFSVPDDFNALTELVVVLMSLSTTTYQFDITSDYGADGETGDKHSSSLLNQQLSMTANQIEEYDISALYASLAAGDHAGFRLSLDSSGLTLYVVGIRMRHTRT